MLLTKTEFRKRAMIAMFTGMIPGQATKTVGSQSFHAELAYVQIEAMIAELDKHNCIWALEGPDDPDQYQDWIGPIPDYAVSTK